MLSVVAVTVDPDGNDFGLATRFGVRGDHDRHRAHARRGGTDRPGAADAVGAAPGPRVRLPGVGRAVRRCPAGGAGAGAVPRPSGRRVRAGTPQRHRPPRQAGLARSRRVRRTGAHRGNPAIGRCGGGALRRDPAGRVASGGAAPARQGGAGTGDDPWAASPAGSGARRPVGLGGLRPRRAVPGRPGRVARRPRRLAGATGRAVGGPIRRGRCADHPDRASGAGDRARPARPGHAVAGRDHPDRRGQRRGTVGGPRAGRTVPAVAGGAAGHRAVGDRHPQCGVRAAERPGSGHGVGRRRRQPGRAAGTVPACPGGGDAARASGALRGADRWLRAHRRSPRVGAQRLGARHRRGTAGGACPHPAGDRPRRQRLRRRARPGGAHRAHSVHRAARRPLVAGRPGRRCWCRCRGAGTSRRWRARAAAPSPVAGTARARCRCRSAAGPWSAAGAAGSTRRDGARAAGRMRCAPWSSGPGAPPKSSAARFPVRR